MYLASLGLGVRELFSARGEWEVPSSCGAGASHRGAAPVPALGLRSTGSVRAALGLTAPGNVGCYRGREGLSLGLESSALAGRLFTAQPPGKPKVAHTLSALLLSCWIFKNCFFVTKDIAGRFCFLAPGLSESLEFQASCCPVSGGFTQLHILVRTDLSQVLEGKADTNYCMQTVSGITPQDRVLGS